MRNGNHGIPSVLTIRTAFLPYLWGMETRCGVAYAEGPYLCSYRTYEEWKHSPNQTFALCVFQVLTVPMRNGNRYNGEYIIFRRTGSYRTYEEWKLLPYSYGLRGCSTFLPYLWGMETPLLLLGASCSLLSSYRTYEEWKHHSYQYFCHLTGIEFLPYLWGMETCYE